MTEAPRCSLCLVAMLERSFIIIQMPSINSIFTPKGTTTLPKAGTTIFSGAKKSKPAEPLVENLGSSTPSLTSMFNNIISPKIFRYKESGVFVG